MQTTEVTLGALERRIDMSIPLESFEKDVEARLKRMARTVKMAGFRPGKVPYKMVEQTYGPQVRSEAMGEAVERAFGEKIREQNLKVAGYPRIEPKESATEGVAEFSAVFEVYPEVTVGDLSTKEIERPQLVVGDAEVDHTIDVLRKQRAVFEPAERASQEGDRVVIDFTGRKDGEVFDGGQATDFPVQVGGGQMLPDFDAQLRGLSAGESRTFDLTFPADYHAKNLAGQTVQFEIAVKTVEAPRLPEVDETFAKALGVVDGDVAKMRAEIKSNLEREVKRRVQARVREQAFDALLGVCSFEVPKSLIEGESQRMAEAAKQDMVARGMNAKSLPPVEPSWFVEQATRRVKLGLLVAEIVNSNDLNAKPEQVRAQIEELAQSYEEPEHVVKWYYSKPENLSNVQDAVVESNVIDWVLGRAKVVDKDVSFDALMGTNPA